MQTKPMHSKWLLYQKKTITTTDRKENKGWEWEKNYTEWNMYSKKQNWNKSFRKKNISYKSDQLIASVNCFHLNFHAQSNETA